MQGRTEVWFSNATPKYAFLTWLVVKNIVATGERMVKWKQNMDTSCIFCQEPMETRDHLFFLCPYSRKVWEELMSGLLLDNF
ncbi:putative reverse transcriptase zinc-binding domain-containing protein [Arabidopsis thaliana]